MTGIAYPGGLRPLLASGGEIQQVAPNTWRLQAPPGRGYRLAQLDDYEGLRRSELAWQAPFRLSLRARSSAVDIPGTWGFGLWNDPFAMAMSLSERALRLPALPNTAWFFHASPPNYLSLRDDLPAQGWLAGTFRAPRLPSGLLALGAPGLALLALPPAARPLRRLAGKIVRQATAALAVDPTDWHAYAIEVKIGRARFAVDGETVLDTPVAPLGRLGVVIWIDNQFMRFGPDGRLRAGTLEVKETVWIEIADLLLDRTFTFV